ncbi:MAG: ABC transporter ATP-binding protein [Lactobacillus sp.]
MIELKHVSKIYGSGQARVVAIQDINFKIVQGEVALLMGPSGAGKSTLLTIAGSLQRPSSGEVVIAGQEVSKLSTRELSKLRLSELGFVLQAYNLVPFLTVAEQFQLVDRIKHNGNLSHEELDKLLQRLDIKQLLNKYPNQLSGGQRQRVSIARALYPNPSVILADEPTASLDSERAVAVGQLFQQLAQEYHKAVLLVTHDQRLETYADHIYQMLDGKIQVADN